MDAVIFRTAKLHGGIEFELPAVRELQFWQVSARLEEIFVGENAFQFGFLMCIRIWRRKGGVTCVDGPVIELLFESLKHEFNQDKLHLSI